MKSLKKILVDMVPVILGVLIALFINDWKQGYDDQRFLTKALASIDKEMTINLDEFSETLPKQYALIDTIEVYLDDNEITLTDIFVKSKGLQVPTVKNTSWKSFLNSKMELVDFEVISKLTDIEESKGLMGKKLDGLMDFVLNNSESTEAVSKKKLMIQLLNLIDSEEQLLSSYEEYLEIENKASR
ncbi:MAG: hypothetical protein AB8H12_08955 [Lewinella sp.]